MDAAAQPAPDVPGSAATDRWVHHHPNRLLAIALALIAGYVDAFGFLVLFGAFVGHMSGNVVAGLATLATDDRVVTYERLLAIPAFIGGIAIGYASIEIMRRRGTRRENSVVLLVEVALLSAFTACGFVFSDQVGYRPDTVRLYILTVLAAMAMGVQTANLRRVEGVQLHTTFISGSITAVTVNAVAYLFARSDLRREPTSEDARQRKEMSGHAFAVVGSTLATFAIGALVAAFLRAPLGFWTMIPAILGLVALAAVMWNRQAT